MTVTVPKFAPALVACACIVTAAAAQAPAEKPAAVPFTLLPSRHMVIEASLNGKGPYKFIFDTGAPINLVSGRVAKEAGLTARPAGGGLLMFAGPRQANIAKLRVGDVTAEAVPAMVMDHPTVQAISEAFRAEVGPIQGIIGFPFFARFAMAIDYQQKELLLTPTDYKPGDYLNDLFKTLEKAIGGGSAAKVVAPAGLWGVAVAKPEGDAEAGVVVTAVAEGGPAAVAGLQVGDRLLTADGRWTDTPADLALAASLIEPGLTVEVVVGRDGREVKLRLTPANGL